MPDRENDSKKKVRHLAALLIAGYLTYDAWKRAMRDEIEAEYIRQYVAGIGGAALMLDADWNTLQTLLDRQYGYLDTFANELTAGRLSEDEIGARSELYISSATQAFERGKVSGKTSGELELPAYPGDGSTPCLTNCQCEWDVVEEETEWQAFWRLGPTEHCDVCSERSETWNPYVVEK